MFLRGFFRIPVIPAPAIRKEEPFITGANLERAERYLKSLKAEKDNSTKNGEPISRQLRCSSGPWSDTREQG